MTERPQIPGYLETRRTLDRWRTAARTVGLAAVVLALLAVHAQKIATIRRAELTVDEDLRVVLAERNYRDDYNPHVITPGIAGGRPYRGVYVYALYGTRPHRTGWPAGASVTRHRHLWMNWWGSTEPSADAKQPVPHDVRAAVLDKLVALNPRIAAEMTDFDATGSSQRVVRVPWAVPAFILRVSALALGAVCAVLGVWAYLVLPRRGRRLTEGLCPGCAYPLVHAGTLCPECGWRPGSGTV